nr:hypothetical protein [Asgard group archaeon]
DDDTKDKPATTGGFSFGAKKEEEKKDDKAGATTGATTATTTTTSEAQPNLKPTKIEPIAVSIDNKTLDDLIVKWSKQLTTTSNIFDSYTEKVKVWDEKLVESGDDIVKLNQESLEAEALQSKINQQLLFVENQQDELEKVLDNYEAQAEILLNTVSLNNPKDTSTVATAGTSSSVIAAAASSSSSSLTTTDELREKAFTKASQVDNKLNTLQSDLNVLISEMNNVSDVFNGLAAGKASESAAAAASKSGDKNPIEEIVKLLNLQLQNLQYIEQCEEELESKLKSKQQKK